MYALTTIRINTDKPLKMVKASDALRACVKAIFEEDATALLKAVESTQLPVEMAMNVAAQAWRKDVGRNKIGDKLCEGGLLSAVYVGVMHAQEAACIDTRADNANTLLVSLAVKEDDPRLVDLLIDWDPHFRMGPSDSKATVDTTAQFFLDLDAPKCAARLLERKTELLLAPRNRFLDDHGEERVLQNAKDLLAKRAPLHPLTVSALEDLIENKGKIPVLNFPDGERSSVFSMGLSLLGRPEILAVCSTGKVEKVSKRIRKMVGQSIRGGAGSLPDANRFVNLGDDNFLVMLTEAAKHLCAPGKPAIVFLKA